VTEHYLREDLAGETSIDKVLSWGGEVAGSAAAEDIFRNKEGRKTLRFERNGKSYFLKLHSGIGWSEIVKNMIQFRLPVLGASNEYRAVCKLRELGVDTLSVAAYASQGINPASLQSMIVTDDLVGTMSLEDYCANWTQQAPSIRVRHALLKKLANSAARMHGAGINHRDFYICHFHLDPQSLQNDTPRCFLIDLHRAQMRPRVPRRWLVKDLAGLYFSAMDCGLTRRDALRFIRHYSPGGLRGAQGSEASLWRDVAKAAAALYRKDHRREPPGLSGPGLT
jgi:heptose I phosphotransferase